MLQIKALRAYVLAQSSYVSALTGHLNCFRADGKDGATQFDRDMMLAEFGGRPYRQVAKRRYLSDDKRIIKITISNAQ